MPITMDTDEQGGNQNPKLTSIEEFEERSQNEDDENPTPRKPAGPSLEVSKRNSDTILMEETGDGADFGGEDEEK